MKRSIKIIFISSLTSSLISNLFSALSILLISKLSGIELLGEYATIRSIFGILSIIFGFRINDAIDRNIVQIKDNKIKFETINSLLKSIFTCSALVFFVGFIIVFNLNKFEFSFLTILFFGLSIIFNSLNPIWAGIARHELDKLQLILSLNIEIIVRSIFIILFLYLLKLNMLTIAACHLLSSFISLILGNNYIRKYLSQLKENIGSYKYIYPWRLNNNPNLWPQLKSTYLVDTFSGITAKFDLLAIAYLYNAELVGIFKLTKTIFSIMNNLISIIRRSYFQEMAEQAISINKQELFKYYLKRTKRTFLYFAFLGILLTLIVSILFKFNTIEYSSLIFKLLIPLTISNVISGTFFWTSSVILLQNKYKAYFLTCIFHSIISVSVLYYLTYKYELIGTSLSYILISILGVTVHLLALKYQSKKSII